MAPGCSTNHWKNTKLEKILKPKYDQQICVRINDKLREAINDICEDANINTTDYIRSRLVSSKKYDVQNMNQVREKFCWGNLFLY